MARPSNPRFHWCRHRSPFDKHSHSLPSGSLWIERSLFISELRGLEFEPLYWIWILALRVRCCTNWIATFIVVLAKLTRTNITCLATVTCVASLVVYTGDPDATWMYCVITFINISTCIPISSPAYSVIFTNRMNQYSPAIQPLHSKVPGWFRQLPPSEWQSWAPWVH